MNIFDKLQINIGKRLRSLREEKELSQKELGLKLGVAASTIGMYETGKRAPDNEMLNRIAEFYGVTTDYILLRTNDKRYILAEDDKKRATSESIMLELGNALKKDGCLFDEKDLPNLILACKIALANNKKGQDD